MPNTNKKSRNSKRQKAAIQRHRLNPSMFIVPAVEANPRRKGSFGHKSMQVILSARKPMTVATFEQKGGRLRDLHWDVNSGHVKLAKKAG